MRRAFVMLAVTFAAAGTGCMAGMAGHAANAPAPASASMSHEEASAGMGGMSMQNCPMSVPGTQVAAADIPEGEAITFTTSPERVGELRMRVRTMADMHNRHHQGGQMEGMHGGTQHGQMMGSGSMESSGAADGHDAMMPPPSRAVVQDVDGGARIVVTPADPADLDRLRSTVRMHAEHMRDTGTCGTGHMGTH